MKFESFFFFTQNLLYNLSSMWPSVNATINTIIISLKSCYKIWTDWEADYADVAYKPEKVIM